MPSRTSTSIRPSGRCGGPASTSPVVGVEVALVAGALHLAAVGLVVDDAAEVGALLAEGPQLAAGQVHEDGRVGAVG